MKPITYIAILVLLIISAMAIFFNRNFFSERESDKKTVLFLCVHNTFRSQIAEAYFNKFSTEMKLNWQAKSAGFLEAEKINEKAVILMREEGIDISDKKPKLLTFEMNDEVEKIVVVCQECEEEGLCIALPQDKEVEYWGLKNPAEMEIEGAREIRDKIKERVKNLIAVLKNK